VSAAFERELLFATVRSVLACVALLALVARVNANTVVVSGGDEAFRSALADILVDADVVLVDDATPVLGELGLASRRLADDRGATAIVWLTATADGATLVTYDRTTDRFVVRELPFALPLAATQAAEAARMVRTMLRALRVEDVAEPPEQPVTVTTPATARAQQVIASAGIGAWIAAPGAAVTPQLTLAVAVRPHALGAALVATLAPAADVTTARFGGDVREVALAIEVRGGMRLTSDVVVSPAFGFALHVVELAGAVDDMPISSTRVNAALRAGLGVRRATGSRLVVGGDLSADCLLRRQSYETATERILVIPRVQVIGTFWLGIGL
jgi:hypothetical protein